MKTRLKHDPNFRRLKQGGVGVTGRTSYWLGPDHLLVVEVANYAERYRRFYFRDIQAIIVQSSSARNWWNLGFAIFALVPVAGLLYGIAELVRISRGGLIQVIIFSIACLALVLAGLVNSLRGPTCSVCVRTAVQTQKLRGITRWRKADALLAELTPVIQAAQARLPAVVTETAVGPASAESAAAESLPGGAS